MHPATSYQPCGTDSIAHDPPEDSLWEFVPLSDYAPPSLSTGSAATNAWSSLRQIFRRQEESPQPPHKQVSELHTLPQTQLPHLVPAIPWGDAANALQSKLQDWLTDPSSGNSVKFIVGQPFSEHAEIIALMGERNRAQLITPPTVEQIVARDKAWIDEWPSTENLWVLPNLEHCYLRHANGMNLVRHFLGLARTGKLGRGIIGCDSWAWAFLQHISPLPSSDTLTLQAFDAERLQQLLCTMVTPRAGKRLHFYNAANGKEIISIPAEQEPPQDELVKLAAHCRGNVATELHYWGKRLRTEPEQEQPFADDTHKVASETQEADESVWVTEMLPDPSLPTGDDEELLLVLHAILLHGGVPEGLFPDLLPFPSARCNTLLMWLQQGGLIHYVEGRWQPQKMAYAAIRRLLHARDYLTDEF